MFAELIINIEAPLENSFHYHIPRDLQSALQIGHLTLVEFGRRQAQGIVIAFSNAAPIEETKPIIAIIEPQPILKPWQIELAQWMSANYRTPLNSCLRLLLPPGITRWADITVDINPRWDGTGLRTEAQEAVVSLLREKGDRRGRQIKRALPKIKWEAAVNQLAQRDILIKGSVLDPPRMRPKKIRSAELVAGKKAILAAANQLGRRNKQADVISYLANSPDPLPAFDQAIQATNAASSHINALAHAGILSHQPAAEIIYPAAPASQAPAPYRPALAQLPAAAAQFDLQTLADLRQNDLIHAIQQPATLSLAISTEEALTHIFRLRKATVYQAVLDLLAREAQPVSLSQIYAQTKSTISHLRKLAKLELIRFRAEEVWRDPLADRDFMPASPPQLTRDQARIWGRVKMATMLAEEEEPPAAPKPILLHGVTGSGKTEIYMRAIEFAVQMGKRAIALVPEIALTPQTVRRFAARFPGQVALMHSRLSDGERYDTWRRARAGMIDILIGPRSALFAPMDDLGVIVLDEEHDASYKQTPPVPPPYYHARDVAIALGKQTGATVILGSATPDIVSYHKAQADQYQLLELPKRVMGHRQRIASQAQRLELESGSQYAGVEDSDDALTIPLPPVQIVDLRQELRAGNRSIFSRALQTALDETLARGEQAILFLNRRGTATFVICRDCGHQLRCPRCDMPLTYHRPHALLTCHHCGWHEPPHDVCPNCGSKRIKYFGLGTEELEERALQRWNNARIVRWDRDTTAGKNRHDQLLASFINQEADILVGTQMIAKGLDLPLVTLVGVISADVSLGLPDYRTGERAFQLLAQVAGRAGRGLLGGRVILQTYQPDHYAITAAADHDYASFYLDEIRFRTQYGLPPFRRLIKLLIADPVNARAQKSAESLAAALRRHVREKALAGAEIVGPAPPFFNRIDGRYRWQILARTPDPKGLLADFPLPRPWLLDIDPVSAL